MTAKPRSTATPSQNTAPEQPGSLMDSIQSEVSAEASPMLQFLANNARIIVLVLVLFIAGIAGYWIYSGMAEKDREAEIANLGKILLISDTKTRLAQLESFAGNAPKSVNRQTWYSIMEAAHELKDYDKLYDAWSRIREFDDSIRVTATIGMADARSSQKKYKEALDLLDGVTANLKDGSAPPVYMRIMGLAEYLGDYERALSACTHLLTKTTNPADISLWTQKKAILEEKLTAEKK